jgi:nicotinamide-nucleotide amidase
VSGANESTVRAGCDTLAGQARKLLGSLIYGEDNDTLESIVSRLLKEQKKTVAFAESCTGGLVSKLLTDSAGASDIFLEGIVTYHNDSKIKRLGVSKNTLVKHGAVSEQTALAMARGMKRSAGSDLAVSVTGIAGPTGDTPDKPLGLVWIGLATDEGVKAHKFVFGGDRATVRQRAAQNAFNLLRKELLRGR